MFFFVRDSTPLFFLECALDATDRLVALNEFSALFHRQVSTVADVLHRIGLDLRAVRDDYDGAEPCVGCTVRGGG